MRIGHYVSVIACKPGFERNVSGHVQVPLHSIKLLMDAGHECHLFTQAFTDDRPAVPFCLPPGLPLHTVTDGRKRKKVIDGVGMPIHGIKLRGVLNQARDIVAHCRRLNLDILHLHGHYGTALLAGTLPTFGLTTPTVVSIVGPKFGGRLPQSVAGIILSRVGRIITATEFVASKWRAAGFNPAVIRHGIIRDLRAELAEAGDSGGPIRPRHRVLFWRDPSVENGCDIAAAVFDRLAPRYPDITFTFAVRPHWGEIPGLDNLALAHPNIEVHRFPYPPGTSLPRLIAESLCILMPMRVMSIDPQLVIAESLAAGVPVIATRQRSNPEVVTPGKSGDLVPLGDTDAAAASLDRLLADRPALLEMGRFAEADIARRWNWAAYTREVEGVYEQVRASSAARKSA